MSGTTNVPGVCIIMKHAGKVLFVLRSNTGFKDGEYGVPGGHVEDDETFKQAACREAMEETGVHIRPEDLVYKCTVHRKSVDDIRIDVWFEAMSWQGDPVNNEPDRHSGIEWFAPQELPKNTMDYMHFGLDVIADGQTYGEFNWQ